MMYVVEPFMVIPYHKIYLPFHSEFIYRLFRYKKDKHGQFIGKKIVYQKDITEIHLPEQRYIWKSLDEANVSVENSGKAITAGIQSTVNLRVSD
jgi:hypothetical protein